MEENPQHVLPNAVVGYCRLRTLSGSEAHDGALLVVVVLPPVPDVAGFFEFQVERIDTVVPVHILHPPGGLVQIDHADQRIERFEPIQIVVLIHAAQVKYLIHIL